jgi:hypothetical protein
MQPLSEMPSHHAHARRLGERERTKTFDWSEYSMEQLSRVWLPSENEQRYFLDIAKRAERDGRSDLAAAARASFFFRDRNGRSWIWFIRTPYQAPCGRVCAPPARHLALEDGR